MCSCKKCKKREKKIPKIPIVRNIQSDVLFENKIKQAYIAGLPVKIYDVDPFSNVFQAYELNIYYNPYVVYRGEIDTDGTKEEIAGMSKGKGDVIVI